MKIIYIVALTLFIVGCEYAGEEPEEEFKCPVATSSEREAALSYDCSPEDNRPIEISDIDFSEAIEIPVEPGFEGFYKRLYLEEEHALLTLAFQGPTGTITQLFYSVYFFEEDITYDEIAADLSFNEVGIDGVHSKSDYSQYDTQNFEILSAEYLGRTEEATVIVDQYQVVDQYHVVMQLNFIDGQEERFSFDDDDAPTIQQFRVLPFAVEFTLSEPVVLFEDNL